MLGGRPRSVKPTLRFVACALFFSCVQPAPVTAPLTTAPTAPTATPRAHEWILAVLPPFVTETPMHGGPAWSLVTSQLPARLASRAIVIPHEEERGLSTVPNLTLRFVDDAGRTTKSIVVLEAKEFDAALFAKDDRAAAFDRLAAIVKTRVADANAALDAEAPTPFAACTIAPSNPYEGWPPCGAAQTIDCGATKMTYERHTLTTPRGPRTDASWKKADVPSNDGSSVEVNECIGDAWIERTSGTLVARFANLCAVPGDWCSVPSDWRVISVR